MTDLLKQYRLVIAVIITLLGLLILLFRVEDNSKTSLIQSVSQTIVYPFEYGVNKTVNFVTSITSSYLFLFNLKKENDILKKQIDALNEEVNLYIEESIRYHRLKIQLEFAEENDVKRVFAEVIGESIDNFNQSLLINRGLNHGIKRNFAVVLKQGVVGRIESVSPLQSSVQMILDRRSRFPAIVQSSRTKGIIYGTGNGLELRRIHLRALVKRGDRVITSGLSGLFRKGLLVGIIDSVKKQEHELFQTAILTPVVDFNKIEGVFVSIKNKEQIHPLFSK